MTVRIALIIVTVPIAVVIGVMSLYVGVGRDGEEGIHTSAKQMRLRINLLSEKAI